MKTCQAAGCSRSFEPHPKSRRQKYCSSLCRYRECHRRRRIRRLGPCLQLELPLCAS